MPLVQPTTTLNVDNQAYSVEKMSPQIQQLVGMFDEWRQKEVDAQSELLLLRAALRDLQRELYSTVTTERDAAIKAASAFVNTAPLPEAPVPTVAAANEGSATLEQ